MNKNGSILIWTMILSLFIIVLFISIDSIFKKSLFFSNFFEQRNIDEADLISVLDSLKNDPKDSDSSRDYSIKSVDYSGATFSGFLSNRERTELWISNSGGTSVLTGSIIEGGLLLYKLIAFNTGTPSSAIISSSGILTSTGVNLNFSEPYNYNILYLEGSGGLVSYKINRALTNLLPQKNIYKLYKNIGNYEKFIRNFEIENFGLKSYSGINYTLLGLYP